MFYLVCYVATLIVYVGIDATWLSFMASRLYRPALGDILLPTLKLGPGIAFYLMYPIGVVFFAVLPAYKAGSVQTALINGAVFGAIAYGTYDLTNFATLRNWTLQITIADMVYGAIASSLAALAGYEATRLFAH